MTCTGREAAAQVNDYSGSVMVALRPSVGVRAALAALPETTEDVDDLHVTLAYLGEVDDLGGEFGRERLYRACYGASLAWQGRPAIRGRINGAGWFVNDDASVLVALWDLPYLSSLRTTLLDQCSQHGVPLRTEDHGFISHTTLSYQDECTYEVPRLPPAATGVEAFDSMHLCWGDDPWQAIPILP